MSYRATEIMQALDWIRMARDEAIRLGDYRGDAIMARLDRACERIHSALDIQPSKAAIEEVIEANRSEAEAA